MTAEARPDSPDSVPSLIVPEIRDYHKINAELVALLDAGHPRIRLVGVEAQRLLVSRLRGSWRATVEIDGQAGPELGLELYAPDLTLICRGDALDGVGSGLVAGTVIVRGNAGSVAGYSQRGGLLVIQGGVGPRAGLRQSGGVLILQGAVGPLVGDRQSGGYLFAPAGAAVARAGTAGPGGRFIALDAGLDRDSIDQGVYQDALHKIPDI